MATLASLKLVAAKKPSQQNPVINRRAKLANKIQEQILLARAHNEGSTYAPTRIKTVTNGDGDRVQVTQAKRITPWWFVAEGGKFCVEIRYGSKVIEISKNKTAIELTSPAALVETLQTVHTAVNAGELDPQIEAASLQLREGFSK